jgi:hypothetical protein
MPIAVPLPIAKGGTAQAAEGLNAFAAGESCVASAENSVAVGLLNSATGHTSNAFGYGCSATETNSFAIGKFVQVIQQRVMEFGYWSSASSFNGRTAVFRADEEGLTSFSVINQENPLTDGGEFFGFENRGTLPRKMMAFRTYQGRLFLDTNDSDGVVKTREINATYRGQCSLDAPNPITFTDTGYGILTGNATFDQNVAYGTSGDDFIITNTSGENRVFNVTAQVEIEKTTSGTIDYGLKIVKNNSLIDETEVQENSSLNNPAYLTTTWMVGLNDQESVALAIASVSNTGPATVNRARLTMFAV